MYSSAAIDIQAPPGLGFILNDEVKSRYSFIPGTGKFNGVPGDTWRMMSDQGRGHFSNFQILMNATHEYSRSLLKNISIRCDPERYLSIFTACAEKTISRAAYSAM